MKHRNLTNAKEECLMCYAMVGRAGVWCELCLAAMPRVNGEHNVCRCGRYFYNLRKLQNNDRLIHQSVFDNTSIL